MLLFGRSSINQLQIVLVFIWSLIFLALGLCKFLICMFLPSCISVFRGYSGFILSASLVAPVKIMELPVDLLIYLVFY